MGGSGTDSYSLLMLAVLPAFAVMFFVWKMDKREKEPVKLLLQLLGLGALTTISAIILEQVFIALLNGMTSDWYTESDLTGELIFDSASHRFWYQFITAFGCVALVEESGKFLMLYLRTWKCPEFDFSYDAVVYAVASSLGFATVENILYVFRSENGVGTALMRAMTSVPGHAIFAIFMGCFYGKAKHSHYIQKKSAARRNMLLALLVPTLLHGFYDFCLFMQEDEYLIAFFGFEIIITIVAIFMIIRLSHHDKPVADPKPVWPPFVPPFGYPNGYPQPYRPAAPGYPAQTGYPQPYRPPVTPAYPAPNAYMNRYPNGYVRPGVTQNAQMPGLTIPNPATPAAPTPSVESAASVSSQIPTEPVLPAAPVLPAEPVAPADSVPDTSHPDS